MIYMKHPALGNKHLPASEQSEREAAGWVRWPRTPEQKSGQEVKEVPQKRGPGRPKKE